MDELTERQRKIIEATLIGIGVVACLVYIVNGGGNLLVPEVILFGMGAVAGYVGVVLRFARRDLGLGNGVAYGALIMSLVPLLVALFTAFQRHPSVPYLVLAAYGLVVGGAEAGRYITRRYR